MNTSTLQDYAKKLFRTPIMASGHPARQTKAIILYDDKDISTEIQQYVKSITIDDELGSKADAINITLEDRPEIWKADWLPERGAMLTVSLISTQWVTAGDLQELPLGKFEIDEIECSGAPEEVKIKGISVPNNAEIRSVDHNQAWEKTKLSVIAKEIADRAKMTLFFDADDAPELDRADQTEETNLAFLQKLCSDAGLCLKVSDEQIIIIDEQKYEEKEPVVTIIKGNDSTISYSITSTIQEVYKACHVKYQHGKKEELIEYTYTDPNRKEGLTLQVNEKVEDIAAAEKLAKKKLREKNKEECKGSITMVGNFYIMAGITIKLEGFGKFDNKYIVTKASHSLGNGYTVQFDIRRCISGY